VDSLRQNYDVLTGDMLLAAAFTSYAGPFTNKFRASLVTEFIKFLSDKGAPMTEGITGVQCVCVCVCVCARVRACVRACARAGCSP
jgi:hypothetical protein